MIRFTIATSLTMLLAIGCKSTKETTPTTAKTVEIQTPAAEEDCYYPRKTIRTITEEGGAVLEIDGKYLIDADSRGRYLPCSVPTAYQQVGLRVIFTGDKLEIFPNERLMGSPLRLQQIRVEKE